MQFVESVIKFSRLTINEVWRLGIFEFLTYITYINEKIKLENERIRKNRR